jgi:hypothetical protein
VTNPDVEVKQHHQGNKVSSKLPKTEEGGCQDRRREERGRRGEDAVKGGACEQNPRRKPKAGYSTDSIPTVGRRLALCNNQLRNILCPSHLPQNLFLLTKTTSRQWSQECLCLGTGGWRLHRMDQEAFGCPLKATVSGRSERGSNTGR